MGAFIISMQAFMLLIVSHQIYQRIERPLPCPPSECPLRLRLRMPEQLAKDFLWSISLWQQWQQRALQMTIAATTGDPTTLHP